MAKTRVLNPGVRIILGTRQTGNTPTNTKINRSIRRTISKATSRAPR